MPDSRHRHFHPFAARFRAKQNVAGVQKQSGVAEQKSFVAISLKELEVTLLRCAQSQSNKLRSEYFAKALSAHVADIIPAS
jgi:hypothetical protein